MINLKYKHLKVKIKIIKAMNIEFPYYPPIVKLPPKVELIILLIKEELKNVRFINNLENAGIDASICTVDFSVLISRLMEFKNSNADEFFEWYFTCQNKLVENIDPDDGEKIMEQAINFYFELVAKKRELDD